MVKIYLAGKVAMNDWRPNSQRYITEALEPWPIIEWNGLLVTGPFFVGCDHGCAHSRGLHGVMDDPCCGASGNVPGYVIRECFRAIQRSDIVFAWLPANVSSLTAHGTMVELGYAKGLGKTIVIASDVAPPESCYHSPKCDCTASETIDVEHPSHQPLHDLWFAFGIADRVMLAPHARAALACIASGVKLESPLETAFWDEHIKLGLSALNGLVAQHEVMVAGERYRLDFALTDRKIGFELDGYTYHSKREAWAKDRRRDLALEVLGWRIHRMDGDLIRNDVTFCVKTAAHLAGQN